jgi:hypothetical protein
MIVAPKPWYKSKTIWSDVGTIALAIGGAAYAYFGQHDATQAVSILVGGLGLGGVGIKGRLDADQPIGSDG